MTPSVAIQHYRPFWAKVDATLTQAASDFGTGYADASIPQGTYFNPIYVRSQPAQIYVPPLQPIMNPATGRPLLPNTYAP